jgi:hypothetical protein
MHALHTRGTEALKPSHLGVQVIGVDVQVHAGGSFIQALGQQAEVHAVQRGAVVLGVIELRQLLAEGVFPERQLARVIAGRYVDDDLEQPAEVCHSTNLCGFR